MTHTADSIYARNRRLNWVYNDDTESWTAVEGTGICISFKDPLDYEHCGKQAEILNRFNKMSKNDRSKLK
jgi:hypothetical protein